MWTAARLSLPRKGKISKSEKAKQEAEIEVQVDRPQKEKKDYDESTAEVKIAIGALKKAIAVMNEGTSFAQEDSFLSTHAKLNEGAEEKAQESASLDGKLQCSCSRNSRTHRRLPKTKKTSRRKSSASSRSPRINR